VSVTTCRSGSNIWIKLGLQGVSFIHRDDINLSNSSHLQTSVEATPQPGEKMLRRLLPLSEEPPSSTCTHSVYNSCHAADTNCVQSFLLLMNISHQLCYLYVV